MLCSVSVFELNVNNAGRGVNVAVFDVNTMQVVKAVRFDTYQSSEGWFVRRSICAALLDLHYYLSCRLVWVMFGPIFVCLLSE